MGKFLKSLFFIIITVLWLFNFINETKANSDEVSFIVTAYYSPLPNQKHYTTWSYAWDKRLNWEGHTTASGKWVYTWILAAPQKYPFGTKIYFEWFGIWAVEDRWWAIVKAWVDWHEHDRIDIWMWYWDEWLQRALKWWKRTIKWKIVSKNSKVNLKFSKNVLKNIENIKVNPEDHKKEDVKKLQENFKKLGLYTWKIDWKYENIKNEIIDFQVKNKIISTKNSPEAWWFWPKTYVQLLRRFWSKDIIIRQDNLELIQTAKEVIIILNAPEIKLNWDKPQSEEVKKVQELFKKIWFYNWNIDWDFNKIRRRLLDFQKETWIIKNDNSWGAWYFWEKTKSELITYFENKNMLKKTKKVTPKKRITIDDISYKTLDSIWKKLQKYPQKNILVKKLTKAKRLIKVESQKNKIEYLINLLV